MMKVVVILHILFAVTAATPTCVFPPPISSPSRFTPHALNTHPVGDDVHVSGTLQLQANLTGRATRLDWVTGFAGAGDKPAGFSYFLNGAKDVPYTREGFGDLASNSGERRGGRGFPHVELQDSQVDAMAFADLNNDGRDDLVLTTSAPSPRSGEISPGLIVRPNMGFSGEYLAAPGLDNLNSSNSIALPYAPLYQTWVDADANGFPDYVIGTASRVGYLYLNDGTGNFPAVPGESRIELCANGNKVPWEIRLADFDQDGALDLLYHWSSTKAWVVRGLYPNATAFDCANPVILPETVHNYYPSPCIREGDVDGDGDLDIVGVHHHRVFLATNNGGPFGDFSTVLLGTRSNKGSNIMDINGDGVADLNLCHDAQCRQLLLSNQNPASRWSTRSFGLSGGYRYMDGDDLNRDGFPDALSTFSSSNLRVFRGPTASQVVTQATFYGCSVTSLGAIWNTTRGDASLFCASHDIKYSVLLQQLTEGLIFDRGAWWIPTLHTSGNRRPLADTDGDGLKEFWEVDDTLASLVRKYQFVTPPPGNDSGVLSFATPGALLAPPSSLPGRSSLILPVDLDRDADLDLITVSGSDLVWLANAASSLPPSSPITFSSPRILIPSLSGPLGGSNSVIVAPLSPGDDALDVLVGTPSSTLVLLVADPTPPSTPPSTPPTFTPHTILSPSSPSDQNYTSIRSLLLHDIDGDAALDLAFISGPNPGTPRVILDITSAIASALSSSSPIPPHAVIPLTTPVTSTNHAVWGPFTSLLFANFNPELDSWDDIVLTDQATEGVTKFPRVCVSLRTEQAVTSTSWSSCRLLPRSPTIPSSAPMADPILANPDWDDEDDLVDLVVPSGSSAGPYVVRGTPAFSLTPPVIFYANRKVTLNGAIKGVFAGKPSILVTMGRSRVGLFFDTTFQLFTSPIYSSILANGDLDGDMLPDAVTSLRSDPTHIAVAYSSAPNPIPVTVIDDLPNTYAFSPGFIRDLNNDGFQDLVLLQTASPDASLGLALFPGTSAAGSAFGTPTLIWDAAPHACIPRVTLVSRFNPKSSTEHALVYCKPTSSPAPSPPRVLLVDLESRATVTSISVPGASLVKMYLYDMDGDGSPPELLYISGNSLVLIDIVEALSLPSPSSPSSSVITTMALDTTPTSLVVGEIDGDWLPDIFVGSSTQDSMLLLHAPNASRIFVPASSHSLMTSTLAAIHPTDFGPLIFDLNKDGFPDIVFPGVRNMQHVFRDTSNLILPLLPSKEPDVWPRIPRTVVDVHTCGWNGACINQAIQSATAPCSLSRTSPSGSPYARVVLPAGIYNDACVTRAYLQPSIDLHIQGAGRGKTILRCKDASQMASPLDGQVLFSAGPDRILVVSDMTIENAFSIPGSLGGGAFLAQAGSSLTLRNVRISSVAALMSTTATMRTPSNGFGGAILATDPDLLLLDNVIISGAYADRRGGGVAVLSDGRADAKIIVKNSVISSSTAKGGGGCLFVETTSGATSVFIDNSTFSTCSAPGDPADITVTGSGGAILAVMISGSLDLNIGTDSAFPPGTTQLESNSAQFSGGSLAAQVTLGSQLALSLGPGAHISSSVALGGGGGGLAVSLSDVASANVSFAGSVIDSNQAATHGGGALLTALVDSRGSTTGPALNLNVAVSAHARFALNQARQTGGGLATLAETLDGTPTFASTGASFAVDLSRAVFTSNTALLGGGLGVLGHVAVSMPVHAGVLLTSNVALAGGAYAGVPASHEFVSFTASLLQAPSSILPPASTTTPCSGMGVLTAHAPITKSNAASYGGSFFLCESRLVLSGLTNISSVLPLPSSVSGGGLLFLCAKSESSPRCSSPANITTPSSSSTSLSSFSPFTTRAGTGLPNHIPWVDLDSTTQSALRSSSSSGLDALASRSEYGSVVASPVHHLVPLRSFPSAVSSGVLFGDREPGSATLEAQDGFGQIVQDARIVLVLGLEVAADGDVYALKGSTTIALSSATVSFGQVSLAVRAGNVPGTSVGVNVVLAQTRDGEEGTLLRTDIKVEECQPGYGVLPPSAAALLECAPCEPLTYSNTTSLDLCSPCPNQIVPVTGATACVACASNTSPDSGAVVDASSGTIQWPNCSCDPGFWTPLQTKNVACLECPEGGACRGGEAKPLPLPNYFDVSPSGRGAQFARCKRPDACVGGETPCSEGTHGYLCGECRPGWFTGASGACKRCPDYAALLFAVLILIVLALSGAVVLFMYVSIRVHFKNGAIRDAKSRVHRVPRTPVQAILYLQIVAIVGSTNLKWSPMAQTMFGYLSIINLDIRFFSAECTVSSFWSQYVMMLMFPLFVVSVAAGCVVLMRSMVPQGYRWMTLERVVVTIAIYAYAPLTKIVLQFFDCSRLPDGTYGLDADLSQRCYGDSWWSVFPAAFSALVLYVFGVPVALLTRLRSSKSELSSAESLFRLGNLYEPYRRKHYTFEVFSLVKRGGVVVCVLFFSDIQLMLLTSLTCVIGCGLLVQARLAPFFLPLHNKVELALNCFLAAVLAVGFFAFADRYDTDLSRGLADVCLALILVSSVLLIMVVVSKETLQIVKQRRAKKRGELWAAREGNAATLRYIRDMFQKVFKEAVAEVGEERARERVRLLSHRLSSPKSYALDINSSSLDVSSFQDLSNLSVGGEEMEYALAAAGYAFYTSDYYTSVASTGGSSATSSATSSASSSSSTSSTSSTTSDMIATTSDMSATSATTSATSATTFTSATSASTTTFTSSESES